MRRCIPRGLTDTRVHPLPALPKLPAAGGTFVDPTYGTTILRVTGPQHGASCQVGYSYWPTFNRDSTRLLVRCDGNARILAFDPKTMQLGPPGTIIALPFDSAEDAIWSGLRPRVLYGRSGARVVSYDLDSRKAATVLDAAKLFPGVASIKQLSRSIDDRVFAFTLQGPGYSTLGYGAVRMVESRPAWPLPTVMLDARDPLVNECQVNKNGRYVAAQFDSGGAEAVEMRIHNLSTRKAVDLLDGSPDYAPAHGDQGVSSIVGHDNHRNQLTVRKLASPHVHRTLISWPEWGGGYHCSMLADGDKYTVVSTYGFGGLYAGEILMVALDGSAVHRLAHHRSEVASYEDQPHANISRDGCFVAFNARINGRRDVFVLRVGT